MYTKALFLLFGYVIACSSIMIAQDENNPCLNAQDFHIVVLGSSTAAGAGPSSSDSTWVNRYRKFLQSINSNNQVTNLAIGGTNTYQIMPSWFVPPVGRPNPNPSNNITQAIILGADAVIVNMPSNDAASGFSTNEQLFNFHTIVNSADSFGIPVWVCTTQPRNFSTSQVQIQLDVRDSVFAAFGAMAIDFWSGLADTSGLPLSIYDSGDGVHLNDAGHRILFNRVKDKNILSNLFVPASAADFAVVDYDLDVTSVCGDSMQLLKAIISNLGQDSILLLNIQIEVTNLDSLTTQYYSDSVPNGLLACASDTIFSNFNTYDGGHYEFKIYLNAADSISLNDTLVFYENFFGHPSIVTTNDVGCALDTLFLFANGHVVDTILWYDSPFSPNAISGADSLTVSGLSSNTTYYAEGVRGDLFYKNSIFTRENTNINFNGYMFDLVASSDLVLDSLQVKFATAGNQVVEVYSKSGSHIGFELDTNAWNLLLTDTINVDSIGDFVGVNLKMLNLATNDSSAYYIKLQNPSSQLSYQSVSTPVIRSTTELSLITGSGISHFFSNSFYPRDLAFEVFYHHGYNPTGDCSTGRIPVEAIISTPQPNLGNDTAFCQQYYNITLNPGNFANFLWSNGSNSNSLFVLSNYYPIGFNTFFVDVTDSIGCIARDSITLNFLLCSGINEVDESIITLFPNPSSGFINYKCEYEDLRFEGISVFNSVGKMVYNENLLGKGFDLSFLSKGSYFIRLESEDYFSLKKVIIQ